MAQVPLHQFRAGEVVSYLSGVDFGTTWRILEPRGHAGDGTPGYAIQRVHDSNQLRLFVREDALRLVWASGSVTPIPFDTQYAYPNQVSPVLFGWSVGPGSIVFWRGTQYRLQAFALHTGGERQVWFTDGGVRRARSTSTDDVAAWEADFTTADGQPIRGPLQPPVIPPGSPEPPPPAVPSPIDFPELPSIGDFRDAVAIIRADISEGARLQGEHFDIIRREIAARQAEITAVPTATAEFVGPLIENSESRLRALIEGLELPTLGDLIDLVPLLSLFLQNPATAILESLGPLTISGDVNEPD